MYVCKKCKQTYPTNEKKCKKCGGALVKDDIAQPVPLNKLAGIGKTGLILNSIAFVGGIFSAVYLIYSYISLVLGYVIPDYFYIAYFPAIIFIVSLVIAIGGKICNSIALKKGSTAKGVSVSGTLCSVALITNVLGLVVYIIDALLVALNF